MSVTTLGPTLALLLALVAAPCAPCRDAETERAPERFVCPTCKVCTCVLVVYHYEYEDPDTSFLDACGFRHFHDGSYSNWSLQCERCGEAWSVRETAPPCSCGWSFENQVWTDPCAAAP